MISVGWRPARNFDESCHLQIAFDLGSDPELVCPASRPVSQWGLPIPEVSLPPGYRLCLWKTTAMESSIVDLLNDGAGATPGIYLLQALPESLNSASLQRGVCSAALVLSVDPMTSTPRWDPPFWA